MTMLSRLTLGVAIFALILAGAATVFNDSAEPRYAWHLNSATGEIYVFDRSSGKIYITSADTANQYREEVWTVLNPVRAARQVTLQEYMRDRDGRQMMEQAREQAGSDE